MTHFLRIAFLLLFLTFGWAEEGTSSLLGGVAESMAHYLDESSQARLFKYAELMYHPVTPPRFYEGEKAVLISSLF